MGGAMDIGIRDASLAQAGFENAAKGLRALGLSALEVEFPRDGMVQSPVTGERLTLDQGGAVRYRADLEREGIRICAFLCAQNFGLDPVEPEIDWIVRAVRAAEAVGVPAIRVDSAMARQSELPLKERIDLFATATRRALDQ